MALTRVTLARVTLTGVTLARMALAGVPLARVTFAGSAAAASTPHSTGNNSLFKLGQLKLRHSCTCLSKTEMSIVRALIDTLIAQRFRSSRGLVSKKR